MARAISLARKGRFTTTPNPNVGCVLVSPEGELVGEGYHQKAGTGHAEVVALADAGEAANGATAYVTLEPCSHYGRTPPCCDALIAAGVSKVIAAMVDPNPQVSGRGLAKLAEAGVEAAHGLLEQDAERLNRGFLKRMRTGRPFVTLKMASSLDGKTALQNGHSKWITGPKARSDVQRHRAQACAVLSGSGTALVDDPSLNVRLAEIGDTEGLLNEHNLRQPLRVILDGRNQLVADRRMFSIPGDTLVINQSHNPALPAHVEQWQCPSNGSKLDLNAVMEYLGQRQINELWIEAGARLAGAFLQENVIDELILYQAPKLLGEPSQGLFDINPLTDMKNAFDLAWKDVRQVGQDLKITVSINQSNKSE